MSKKVLNPKGVPAPVGPYSIGTEFNGMVFFSGQIPLDPQSGQIVGETVEEQTTQVMKNIDILLKETDLKWNQILKSTIFLANMDDFSKVNEIYAQYFTEEPPSRSCVAVKTLPKNVQVEIEILAHR